MKYGKKLTVGEACYNFAQSWNNCQAQFITRRSMMSAKSRLGKRLGMSFTEEQALDQLKMRGCSIYYNDKIGANQINNLGQLLDDTGKTF